MSKLRRNVEALRIGKKKVRDYDPEDDRNDEEESGSGSEEEGTTGGREHYEKVGRSTLRKPQTAPLDSKYRGVVVSRAALAGEESDNDPFALQDGNDEDEDPFAESADAKDNDSGEDAGVQGSVSVEEDGESDVDLSSEVEESDEDVDDAESDDKPLDEEDESEDELAAPRLLGDITTTKAREDLKAQFKASQNLAAGLAKAASEDAKKGQAVKRQYQTFDRLLDARMKLQKGLTASDELAVKQPIVSFTSDADEALQTAQYAALQLFNTIGSFRNSIADAATSEPSSRKRKRFSHVDNMGDIDSIWKSLEELEAESLPSRQTTIDRWSAKAKLSDPGQSAASTKSKFLESATHDNRLTAVLETFVINEQEKFFRSEDAEHQEDKEFDLDQRVPFYDDSVFYQSLLRDLITARSAASANDISISMLPPKLHASGNRQNKKAIDTKASKGRKIRYTVHDKLQNFMASEGDTGRDTAMWTERGKNEFFGSLFGQDRVLREDDEDKDMVDEDNINEDGAEVEALRLFRT